MDRRKLLKSLAFGGAAWIAAGRPRTGRSAGGQWESIRLPQDPAVIRPVTTALAARPGTDQIATGGDDHQIRLWQLDPPRLHATLAGHADWVRALLFLDASRLVSASDDGTLRLWSAGTPEGRHEILVRHRAPWTALAKAAGSDRWAAGAFDGRVVWFTRGTSDMKHADVATGDLRAIVFSHDGRTLYAAGRDGRIHAVDLDDGRLLAPQPSHHRRRRALVLLPDGRLASGGDDGIVCFTDPRSGDGSCEDLRPSRSRIECLLLWDAHRLLVGGSDNRIRLLPITPRPTTASATLLEGHTGTVAALCRVRDWLVSAGYDTTIRRWHVGPAVAVRPAPWRPRRR